MLIAIFVFIIFFQYLNKLTADVQNVYMQFCMHTYILLVASAT